MSLAEIAEVTWLSNCLQEEILFCGSDVEKVLNCTGKSGNSCGVRISGWICFESQLKAVRRMCNFTCQVSDWEVAAVREGLHFVG